MSLVCGTCRAYRPTRFCGECGSQCYNENQCTNTQCATLAANCNFCPNCGGPLYKTLLGSAPQVQQQPQYRQQQQVRTNYVSPGLQTQLQQPQQQYFQETVRPSDVLKGVKAGEEEALSRYRAKDAAPSNELNEDESKFLAKYQVTRLHPGAEPQQRKVQNTAQPTYSYNSAISNKPRPSEALRGPGPNNSSPGGGTWGAKYTSPNAYQQQQGGHQQGQQQYAQQQQYGQQQYGQQQYGQQQYRAPSQPNPYVVQESTVRPSFGKQDGSDDLDKYRVKNWEIQLKNIPAAPGQAVELIVDGERAYSGEGRDGIVSLDVIASANNDSKVILKAPAVNVELSRDIQLDNGRYLQFAVENNSLQFRQQKLDFNY